MHNKLLFLQYFMSISDIYVAPNITAAAISARFKTSHDILLSSYQLPIETSFYSLSAAKMMMKRSKK